MTNKPEVGKPWDPYWDRPPCENDRWERGGGAPIITVPVDIKPTKSNDDEPRD